MKKNIPGFTVIVAILLFSLLRCEPLVVNFDSDYLNQDNLTIQNNASAAVLIFTGTITEIGTPPSFWSGVSLSLQEVTYSVDRIIKGSYTGEQITVSHILVDKSRLAADDTPGLSTTYFVIGKKLIVFAKQSSFSGIDYIDFDEEVGTFLYSEQNETSVKALLASARKLPEKRSAPSAPSRSILTVNGTGADKASFSNLLDQCKERSSTLNSLVSTISNSETWTVTLNLVRDGENIFVDAFNGRIVDIDDLERWHEGCNERTDLCQLFGHFLQEYWHAEVTGDGYAKSHESALNMENQIRKDLGKTTELDGHVGLREGEDLFMITNYNGTAERVKIGGGNNPRPEGVDVPPPTISTSTTSLSFDHTIGASPCPQTIGTIEIQNTGGGTLNWEINSTVERWLSFSAASGTATTTITLYFTCDGSWPADVEQTFRITGSDPITGKEATNSVTVTVSGSVHY